MSKDRLEAFSDGVFGIVLSLLILQLYVPNVVDHSSLESVCRSHGAAASQSDQFRTDFCDDLYPLGESSLFFQPSPTRDSWICLVNNFFLLWMCFLPFPTAMLGDHLTDLFPILLYGVNSLFLALTFYGFRSYASHVHLIKRSNSKALGPRHSLPAVLLYALSIVLAFINVYLSLACFFIVPYCILCQRSFKIYSK